MKKETPRPQGENDNKNLKDSEGYPLYPPSEDIYNKFKEVKDIDPEEIANHNGSIIIPHIEEIDLNEVDKSGLNEIDQDEMDEFDNVQPEEFEDDETQEFVDDDTDELKEAGIKELGDDMMGLDLDVPGADLDDGDEEIGSEDEENNYYSIGGDKHRDLEEDSAEPDEE